MGDKASVWGCLPAVVLPKRCHASGWLRCQLQRGRCAQPAVGPCRETTASLAATAHPLCTGHGSQNLSLSPRRVLAPALPTVAWTSQGKLMNSQPGAGAKRSCNLGSNLIAQPNSSVITPASSRGEQKLELGRGQRAQRWDECVSLQHLELWLLSVFLCSLSCLH